MFRACGEKQSIISTRHEKEKEGGTFGKVSKSTGHWEWVGRWIFLQGKVLSMAPFSVSALEMVTIAVCVCVCVCVCVNNYNNSVKWSLSSLPKDFLLQIFTVFRILIRPEMFPKDWTVMRLVANK